jgi:hypothetical protein
MEVTHGHAQNWCLDPFGQHEERWFSRGMPTALVRDHGVEAQDPPPDSVFAHQYSVLAYLDPSAADVASREPRAHSRIGRVAALRRGVVEQS